MKVEFAPLFQLGRAERLQLVEDLWDSIVEEESMDKNPVVTAWKLEELRRRKDNLALNPGSTLSWEQVKQMARGAHD